MRRYDLTLAAENDLRGILTYTLKEWGPDQLKRYQLGLTAKLEAIASNEVVERRFSENLPTVLIAKYEYHFIFYTVENRDRPPVLAILHEKQDIVVRLADRLK